MTSSGFQTQINVSPAPGVEGDFCTTNPRYSMLAGPGGLVAGPAGVTLGRFGWATYNPSDWDGAPAAVNNFGSTKPDGFLVRNGQPALLTTYLQTSGMVVPGGFELYMMTAADVWMKNLGTGQALPGMKVFANLANGSVSKCAATGTSATAGASGSASTVAAASFSATGSIGGQNGNVMTLTAVGSGSIVPGATISGSGIASGTKVAGQILPLLTGEALNGIGRYYVTIGEQSVAGPVTVTGAYGTLTVGGTVTGTFQVGQTISGTSVTAGNTVIATHNEVSGLTGIGGAGTYAVSVGDTAGSTAITAAADIETDWTVRSSALQNEIFKAIRLP